jgi:hypothetical protein
MTATATITAVKNYTRGLRWNRRKNLSHVPKPVLTKTSKPPVPDPGFSQPRDRVGVRRQRRQPGVHRRGGGLRRIQGRNPAAKERCQGVSFFKLL